MYNMGTLLRHGSDAQKKLYLPKIASGELRLQSMAVTEPTTGTDTTKIKTTAVKQGDRYVVNGQKVWISRVQHSDMMILLARTTPLADVKKKSEGMSIFLVDLREAIGKGGILKDPSAGARIAADLAEWLADQPGWSPFGITDSPIAGGDGNHDCAGRQVQPAQRRHLARRGRSIAGRTPASL